MAGPIVLAGLADIDHLSRHPSWEVDWVPRAFLPMIVLLPPLAACTLGMPVESAREVAADPATVAERVAAGFVRLGLQEPEAAGEGDLSASLGHARTDWARCRARLVNTGDGRRQMATAGRRFGEVEVSLAPVPAGTRVEVQTSYTGVYRNNATGSTFQTPCESTGEVESVLLAAAAGEG